MGTSSAAMTTPWRWSAQVRDRAELAARIKRAFPQGIRSPAFKKLLKTSLYPYQREGALFAATAGRALLADDMGLGKTIQAIAAAEILARTAGIERTLVISPTSLKHQWQQEIEKFTGRPALVVEGLGPRRAELYAAESFYKLTNYDVVHRDMDAIRRWQPDLIILDEAQRIKNWQTRAAQSVKQLASPYALVLTGTPLENRLEELHSIVEFVDRFRLGPMFRFLAEHQHTDEGGRVVGYRNLSAISETLAPILLRRTKDKVLKQLPERLEKRFFVPMTEQQADMHQENGESVARLVAKWRRNHFLSEGDQLRLRIALQNMRMSCNSTYLLDQEDRPRREGRRDGPAAGGDLRGPGDEGGGVQPMAADARVGGAAAGAAEVAARALPRRRAGPAAQGPGPPLQGRPGVPAVSGDRRRRRGLEPATRLGGGQPRPALEPGRAGTADRPRPSPRPATAGPGRPFHRPGNHRGRDARGCWPSRSRSSPASWTRATTKSSWAGRS